MNILFTGALSPQQYGAAKGSSEILSLLVAAGHRVTALVPTKSDLADVAETDRVQHAGINVIRFAIPYFETLIYPPPENDRRDLQAQIVAGLHRALKKERFDLIVIGKESLVPGVPALARQARLPCVVISHGAILSVHRPDFPRDFAEQLIFELRQADLVAACANHLAQALRDMGLERTTAIVNAVDTKRFRPGRKDDTLCHQLGIPDHAIVVGHVSSLVSIKRPLDIVESAAIALRSNPELIYLIVGGNANSQRAGMIAACNRLGIVERFRFVDWQDYGVMPQYMQLADLVVYPSESEGLCRGYLETMASGRTLIASDIPAACEVIDDGIDGLLFAVGDVKELTAKTLLAAGDAALRRRIGSCARQKVLDRYAFDGWLAAHEALFERVIDTYRADKYERIVT